MSYRQRTEYDDYKEVAHWNLNPEMITNAWFNMGFSSVAYIWFALLLYACFQQKVFWKHLHTVFLILFFALITDLIEFRMHFFLVFDLAYRVVPKPIRYNDYDYNDYRGVDYYYPSLSVGACSVVSFLFYLHYMITFVEAIVAVYRFAVKFCQKRIPVCAVYIGLGIAVGLKAVFFLINYVFGETSGLDSRYCTRTYAIRAPVYLGILLWLISLSIAPFLTTALMVRGVMRKQRYSGVTAFLLASSMSMALLVGAKFILHVPHYHYNNTPWYVVTSAYVVFVINIFQDFRFLLLNCLATFIVVDIRAAFFATVVQLVRKAFGSAATPSTITNEVFLDGINSEGRIPSKEDGVMLP